MLNYDFDKKRFETFFDGIVAIIVTILVLELRLPEGHSSGEGSTKHMVLSLFPSFVSYIASFLLIMGAWLDHHILFLNLQKLTKRYILLNMLFVLSLSVVPFSTAFAGNHNEDSFAVALLGVNYFVMNIFFGFLYMYAQRKNLVPKDFFSENKKTAIYSYFGVVGLFIAIPLAYVNTSLSFGLFILVFGGHLMKRK